MGEFIEIEGVNGNPTIQDVIEFLDFIDRYMASKGLTQILDDQGQLWTFEGSEFQDFLRTLV